MNKQQFHLFLTTVFAIICKEKCILLVQNIDEQKVKRWTLPGGKVENGETLYNALKREVFEETSNEVSEMELAYAHEAFFLDRSAHVRAFVFDAKISNPSKKGSQKVRRADTSPSVIDTKWVSQDKIKEYITNGDILAPLMHWLKHKRSCKYFFSENIKW